MAGGFVRTAAACVQSPRLLAQSRMQLRLLSTQPHAAPLEGAVRVRFGDGSTGDFHTFWLRLRCANTRHPKSNEQQARPADLDLNENVASASISTAGTHLHVVWKDSSTASEFSLQELQAHNYGPNRAGVDPIETPLPAIEVSAAANWRHTLQQHGAVVVRGYGLDTEKLIGDFESLGLSLWESHFGRIEDLRTDNTTNKNTDQLGYTTAAVDFHTDMPFVRDVPPYQALQCMQPSPCGGGVNKLADARRLALHLRATDRETFDLLTTTPVHLLRQQKAFRSETFAPMLQFEGDKFVQVRSSYFTLAHFKYDFADVLPFVRAYQKFERLLDSPAFSYKVALAKGDFLAYDNSRMLHARTAFTGNRWLRGIYFK